MALLNNNMYIRILPSGEVEFYKNKEDRDIAKMLPTIKEILDKYDELCSKIDEEIDNSLVEKNIYREDYSPEEKDNFDKDVKNAFSEEEMSIYKNKLSEIANIKREKIRFSQDSSEAYTPLKIYSYPYMEKIYPQLSNAIPRYTQKVVIPLLEKENTEEAYLLAKELGLFTETKDI